jgi:hypothetical protein
MNWSLGRAKFFKEKRYLLGRLAAMGKRCLTSMAMLRAGPSTSVRLSRMRKSLMTKRRKDHQAALLASVKIRSDLISKDPNSNDLISLSPKSRKKRKRKRVKIS